MDSPEDIDEALFIAIQQNKRYKVSEWFKKYGSEHTVTSSWSPVHEAAINGHTEILWDLLHRYNFSAADSFELEPDYAEVYGTGSELQGKHQFCNGTALTLALSNGHMATAELLIHAGADVDATYYGEGCENDDMARFFGADISTDEGNCLLLAFLYDAYPIIDLMQSKSLNVDGSWGRSDDNVLSYCLRKGKHERVEKLLSMGADPNQMIIDNDGEDWNALYFAVDHYLGSDGGSDNYLAIIDSLLEHGALADYREDRGNDDTVLEMVIRSGNETLAERFGLLRIVEEWKEIQQLLRNRNRHGPEQMSLLE